MGKIYKWIIIGGGPAGIASIGKLLDSGIKGDDILWLDPRFKVGDLGEKWFNVPSNTKVELFTNFLKKYSSFEYKRQFPIDKLDKDSTCLLEKMSEPLKSVTETLLKKINGNKEKALNIYPIDKGWGIDTDSSKYKTESIVIATGSTPKHLDIKIDELSISNALNPDILNNMELKGKNIAVIGASHSAILVIRNLLECGAKVKNFYRSQLKYSIELDEGTLFDNTGLKGTAAKWAKENMHSNLPLNLERIHISQNNYERDILACDMAVYAIGFNTRSINIEGISTIKYESKNGIIAPGIFGFGLAYPERVTDISGEETNNVGLWKFINYLENIFPIWEKYRYN